MMSSLLSIAEDVLTRLALVSVLIMVCLISPKQYLVRRHEIDQARRLKELEKENGRLKSLVADLTLDNAILKEASRGNF